MSNEIPELFEELKNKRLEQKKTLKQISQTTKIHLKFLEALESGTILEIPEIYDKLFFKSYIKALELSENDYYNRFMEYRKKLRKDRTAIIDMTKHEEVNNHSFNYKNILIFVPIIFVVLVIWFLSSNTLLVEEKNPEMVREIDAVDIAEKMRSKLDSSLTVDTKSDSADTIKLLLSVEALKRTWFRIIIDKKDTVEHLLTAGQKINLESEKTFEFLIGRANGLKIHFNKKEYGPFGEDGQVVKYMLIDSTGIVAKDVRNASVKKEAVKDE